MRNTHGAHACIHLSSGFCGQEARYQIYQNTTGSSQEEDKRKKCWFNSTAYRISFQSLCFFFSSLANSSSSWSYLVKVSVPTRRVLACARAHVRVLARIRALQSDLLITHIAQDTDMLKPPIARMKRTTTRHALGIGGRKRVLSERKKKKGN